MFGVDETGKMRRAHFREGRSIRGISRDLGASRAPVRKVLRSGATELVCVRRTQPRPKIGPWQSELDRYWRRTRRVRSAGFSRRQHAEPAVQVSRHRKEIERAWREHFRWSKNGFF